MRDKATGAAIAILALAAIFGASFMGARIARSERAFGAGTAVEQPTQMSQEPATLEPAVQSPADQMTEEPEPEAPQQTLESKQPTEEKRGIILPGYDTIRLTAQQTEQRLTLYNPSQNECFLIISLMIGNQELYSSTMMSPGSQIEHIILSRPLSAGIYDGALIYTCYDLHTLQQMNGTEMAIKLEVN